MGLAELEVLRGEVASLRKPVGYIVAYKASIGGILDRYDAQRAFLGIGLRKQKRRLRAQINALK